MLRFYPLLLALLPFLALAQNDAPILTLNTEMHTAMIYRMDSDAAGRYVLTASSDKTAKLWDARSGQLLQTYRPPIGAGNEGELRAAAISPDGTYVALGGWSAYYPTNKSHDIYIFHSHTGILQRRISGLPNVVNDLEFSPDGHFLAAALGDKNGIRVYETKSWAVLKKDTDYATRSNNIAFSSNGYLASVCFDGYVRLYDNKFNLLRREKTIGGEQPFSIAFSPDGQKLAIGYDDSPRIQVLNTKSLDLLYEPALGAADTKNDRFEEVAFSRDGQQLIAGGFYSKKQADGKWWRLIRIWEQQGRGSYHDYPAGESTLMDVKTLANGNILYASAQPDWGVLDKRTGSKLTYQAATINDHKVSDRSHFKINTDGTQIGWTPVYQNALRFDVASRSLSEQSVNYPTYQASTAQIKITAWENSYLPKLNGKKLSFLKQYEMCASVDIASHEQSMVFGSNWNIQALDAAGDRFWRTPVGGMAWAVNIAANNKVVAACQGDGTIRWYRMSDGELLLTLFVHPDRQRWVLWTPSGYYDASAGAEDLIGWHVNQGEDSEGLYYPISKFRSSYYRPDVIDRILQTVDEEKALRLADAAAQKNTTITRSVTETLPPSVRILSPNTGSQVTQNQVELSYSIKSPNNEQITGIKILVDGRPLSHERGLKPAGQRETVTVTIPSQDCTVSIIAENRFGSSPASSIDLVWAGQTSMSRDLMKPNLYILAVGVGDYDNDDYDLDFADDDAEAFAAVLQKQEGLLYGQVETKLLTDKAATKDNILDGLDWLVRETTQHDVAMLFFAGHGVEDNRSTFYYLPVGADEEAMRRTCLMKTEIQETVATVTGKIVVFMDACHSGNMMMASTRRNNRDNPDITRIVNELIEAENGAVVFSSSTGRQTSLEDASWGHGAFTKALVEGLSGAAEMGNEGKITCKSLDFYISRRVKELTGGQQTPTTNYPPNVPDFPVSIKQ